MTVKIDHQSYIVPDKIDGQVMHKQAWDRLVDTFRGGQTTIVHAHSSNVHLCNEECVFYHWDADKEPVKHPVTWTCDGHYITDPKKEN